MRMTEEEAYQKFKSIRWAENNGEPVCVSCGCEAYTEIKTRRKFKCKGCFAQYSVTSKTIFASHKLAFGRILEAIALFTNGVSGYSALRLSRDIEVQYKTAFVLLHKIREAVGIGNMYDELCGHVEIDGAYIGGYVKPTNFVKNRRDRRKSENKSPKRRVMVVMREPWGRTTVRVYKQEAYAVPDILKIVGPNSIIHVDEASGWSPLHAYRKVTQINHEKVGFSTDMACTNWAESFHARVRRAERGIHHHICGPYLLQYGLEMCWREDNRDKSNGWQFEKMVHAVTHFPISAMWKGYWQRHRKPRFALA
jgi:transposase-like protein